MSQLPSVWLLFDTSALLAGRPREWNEYGRVGICCVPQVVLDELESLSQNAPEPAQEHTAKDFHRFVKTRTWQIVTARATHPKIALPPGRATSKAARLHLAVAECVYGFSVQHDRHLTVFIANYAPLREQIEQLGLRNLCALSENQLRQWARSRKPPLNVTLRWERMERSGTAGGEIPAEALAQKPPSASDTANSPQRRPRYPRVQQKPWFVQLTSGIVNSVVAIVALTFAGLLMWFLFEPESFRARWERWGLPPLPETPPVEENGDR